MTTLLVPAMGPSPTAAAATPAITIGPPRHSSIANRGNSSITSCHDTLTSRCSSTMEKCRSISSAAAATPGSSSSSPAAAILPPSGAMANRGDSVPDLDSHDKENSHYDEEELLRQLYAQIEQERAKQRELEEEVAQARANAAKKTSKKSKKQKEAEASTTSNQEETRAKSNQKKRKKTRRSSLPVEIGASTCMEQQDPKKEKARRRRSLEESERATSTSATTRSSVTRNWRKQLVEMEQKQQQPSPKELASLQVQVEAHGQLLDALTQDHPAIAAALQRDKQMARAIATAASTATNSYSILPLRLIRLLEFLPWHQSVTSQISSTDSLYEWQRWNPATGTWESTLDAFPDFFHALPVVRSPYQSEEAHLFRRQSTGDANKDGNSKLNNEDNSSSARNINRRGSTDSTGNSEEDDDDISCSTNKTTGTESSNSKLLQKIKEYRAAPPTPSDSKFLKKITDYRTAAAIAAQQQDSTDMSKQMSSSFDFPSFLGGILVSATSGSSPSYHPHLYQEPITLEDQKVVLTNANLTQRYALRGAQGYPLPPTSLAGTWKWIGPWKVHMPANRSDLDQNVCPLKKSIFNFFDRPQVTTPELSPTSKAWCDRDGWTYAREASHFVLWNTRKLCSAEPPPLIERGSLALLRRRQWIRQRVLVDYPHASKMSQEVLQLHAQNATLELAMDEMESKLAETASSLAAVSHEAEQSEQQCAAELNHYQSAYLYQEQRLKILRFGRFKSKIEELSCTADDILPIVANPAMFLQLQLALRASGAITNAMLQQGIHFYIQDHVRTNKHNHHHRHRRRSDKKKKAKRTKSKSESGNDHHHSRGNHHHSDDVEHF